MYVLSHVPSVFGLKFEISSAVHALILPIKLPSVLALEV